MRVGYFDLEGDNLYEGITKVHCVGIALSSADGTVQSPNLLRDIPAALKLLDTCDVIIGHNVVGFDVPALWKLYKWKPKARVVDTLLMSTVLQADIDGGHSLEAWGKRLKEYKGDYLEWCKENKIQFPWAEFRPEMGDYCLQDVRVTVKLYRHLREIKAKGGEWDNALAMEHDFAQAFANQMIRGVYVDKALADGYSQDWGQEMAEIAARVEPLLPPTHANKGELASFTPPKIQFKANGEPSKFVLDWFDEIRQNNAGVWYGKKDDQVVRLPYHEPLKTMVPMTLSDQGPLKTWLMEQGWVPTMWSFKKEKDKKGKFRVIRDADGEPVRNWPKFHDKGVICENLEKQTASLPPVARDVTRWMILRHRLGLVNSILHALRPNGTVPATGMSNGTPTARVTHQVVANFPKPDDDVILGVECRSILVARPGRVLGGVDAAGLEMRCLAHYMNDPEFTKAIVSGVKEDGTDIISLLWTVAKDLISSRGIAKPCIYSWLYGASRKKTGQTAQAPDAKAKAVGKAIVDRWLARFPKLKALVERVQRDASKGFIVAIDGRRIPVRSKHAALNTLLQSCGSILVKNATVYATKRIKELRLDALLVIHMHDELQFDCIDEPTAVKACELFIEGLQDAARRFNFKCPVAGDYSIGHSWADTH